MKQSRLASFTESAINIVVGLGVAMLANAIILPALGFPISFSQNVIIATFMTGVSLIRSYALRRLFEYFHIRIPISPSMVAIIAERQRQKDVEGWTPEHDAALPSGELARAGAAYALMPAWRNRGSKLNRDSTPPLKTWPWKKTWWKPEGDRRDLVKAGALILAELDRSDYERKNKRAAA